MAKKNTAKKKAEKKEAVTVSMTVEAQQDHELKIKAFKLRGKVLKAETTRNKAREILKAANADYTEAVDELLKLLEPLPLFDKDADGKNEPDKDSKIAKDGKQQTDDFEGADPKN